MTQYSIVAIASVIWQLDRVMQRIFRVSPTDQASKTALWETNKIQI